MSTAPQSLAESRLLDVPAAAAYLSVSERTIREWVYKRRVRFCKVGRAVRFRPSDLDAMVVEVDPEGVCR